MSENTIAFRPWMEAQPKELRLKAGVFAPQEEWAWERIARGELADMAMFDPSADRNAADWWKGNPAGRQPDPSSPQTFTDHHILSERFLRTVIFHEPYASGAERPGVRVAHAWLKEEINWSGRSTKGELWLKGCRFDRDVYLQDLVIEKALVLQSSFLTGNLYADRMRVGSGLFLNEGFSTVGELRLLGSKVGGDIALNSARLHHVLNADGLEVSGALICSAMRCVGDLRLIGAKVAGSADFTSAQFERALRADGLSVGGVAFFVDGFAARGEVRLVRATVGGNVILDGATLGRALNLDGLEARGSVFLRSGCRLNYVSLVGAKIGGNVQLSGSTLQGKIDLTGARIDNALELAQLPGTEPIWGEGAELILRNVSCGALAGRLAAFRRVRDGKAERHHFPKLDLVGLHYANLGSMQAEQKDTLAGVEDVKELVALLEAGGDGATFTPGPYQQLARALRHMGHDERADEIMIAMKRHERACVSWARQPLSKLWLYLLDVFSGFGYRNHRALGLFAVVVLLSWGGGLGLSGAVFTPTSEGFDNVVRWFWFALGNATPLITLDDAHRTFLSEQFGAESNRVPLSVASAFYAAKIFGFVILSYYVASVTGLANPRRE